MLYEFVNLNRDLIIERTRDRVRTRAWPSVAPGEVEHVRAAIPDAAVGDASFGGDSGTLSGRRHRCGGRAPRRGVASLRLYRVSGRP